MRILCCADTHARVPPILDESGAIAWLHAGDIENGPDVDVDSADIDPHLDPLMSPIVDWFESRSVPIFVVRGNHDCSDAFHVFRNGRDTTGRIAKLAAGLWLAGIGWNGSSYFELPREDDLLSICETVRSQISRHVTHGDGLVILSHYPPMATDMRDRHEYEGMKGVWYQCIRHLIDELEPLLVVEGHNHKWANSPYRLRHVSGASTLVINPGHEGATIEVDLVENVQSWSRRTLTPSSRLPDPGSATP